MKKISLTEFKKYCHKLKPRQFLFSSEHQPDNSPLGLELTFEQSYIFVSVFLAPNTIAFQNDKKSQLVFEGVKYVNITDDNPSEGIVCEIVCSSAQSPCCETMYVIVMI